MLINPMLFAIAILSIGVVYGTDMFHAVVVKKAAALSKDESITDLMGHTHLIADKRMPFFAVAGIISTLLLIVLNYQTVLAICSIITLAALCAHLVIYLVIAKPINTRMSASAVAKTMPVEIRSMQLKWDSVIIYRAIVLTIAMIAIITGSLIQTV